MVNYSRYGVVRCCSIAPPEGVSKSCLKVDGCAGRGRLDRLRKGGSKDREDAPAHVACIC